MTRDGGPAVCETADEIAALDRLLYGRVQPHWMVTYAFAKVRLLAELS